MNTKNNENTPYKDGHFELSAAARILGGNHPVVRHRLLEEMHDDLYAGRGGEHVVSPSEPRAHHRWMHHD